MLQSEPKGPQRYVVEPGKPLMWACAGRIDKTPEPVLLASCAPRFDCTNEQVRCTAKVHLVCVEVCGGSLFPDVY